MSTSNISRALHAGGGLAGLAFADPGEEQPALRDPNDDVVRGVGRPDVQGFEAEVVYV